MSAADIARDITEAAAGQTVAQFVARTVREHAGEPAIRFKVGEEWDEWSWGDYGDRAARIAAGLTRLGVRPKDRVTLMMRNRPEFHVCDAGALLCGATPFSIYNSSSPEQVSYLVSHSEAKVAIVEDAGFLERFLKVRDELPALEHIVIVEDPEDLAGDGVIRLDDVLSESPVDIEDASRIAQPEDLATLVYTSGTTGPPKGAMITHANLAWMGESIMRRYDRSFAGLVYLSYLPSAHIYERFYGHYGHIREAQVVVPCPDVALLAQYLREVHPNGFPGVPRVWEKIHATIQSVLSADAERKAQVDAALAIGRRAAEHRIHGEELPADLEAQWREADEKVLGPIRAFVGIDQLVVTGSGAAPLPVEVFWFFLSLGLPFTEGFGMTESSCVVSLDPWRPRVGTVGRPLPGVEVKIADDGEVLFRGGNVIPGYFRDPEKTAEAIDADGWFHTGDVGELDSDGYLKIVDRKKELIITAGGKNISPANIESALRSMPLIGQAAAIGDGRRFISALLTLDPDVAPAWARQRGIEAATVAELASHPEVVAEVQREVDDANKRFSNVEQVKKFLILAEEWLPDTDVLTPTMKLKRRGIAQRYAEEIESLYA